MQFTSFNSVFANKFQNMYRLWDASVLEKCPGHGVLCGRVRALILHQQLQQQQQQ